MKSCEEADIGTRWRSVVSFTPWPLYPRAKSPRYPPDMQLGGPHGQPGRCGKQKNLLPVPRLEGVHSVARRYTDFTVPENKYINALSLTFRLSWRLMIDLNPVFRFLHLVVVIDVA
jgi:hypothetical protein